jgi:hypothetical protein
MSLLMSPAAIPRLRSAAGRRVSGGAARLVLALGALAVALTLVCTGSALAAKPTLSITSPADGTVTNEQTPTFGGVTDEPSSELAETSNEITLSIYAGTSPTGSPVQPRITVAAGSGSAWGVGLTAPLQPGTYTARAEQTNGFPMEAGISAPVTFTVDTTPPAVTMTTPADGSATTGSSQSVGGAAGTASGDSPTVTADLYAGSQIGQQAPLESVSVQRAGEAWSAVLGGLAAGASYVVRAEQRDDAGNVGISAPVRFTVAASPPGPPSSPPKASFKWFPTAPRTGEQVALISSSTDLSSALTGFSWSLAPTAAFVPGPPVLRVTFRSPGLHTVRLRVAAADGLSGTASETVRVLRAHVALMQPFPVVRIAGLLNAKGVSVALLTAQVPVGARVTLSCRGGGCPRHSETHVAASGSKRNRETVVLVRFRDFQRSLRAGTVLEIRIYERDRIGKYTRFAIRRRGLPERVDKCLPPTGSKPIACPAS